MSRAGLFAILVAAIAIGCQRDTAHHEPAQQDPQPAVAPGRRVAHAMQYVERFERGADASSPLLVVLHGRGDTAEGFLRVWQGFPAKLQIISVAAPHPLEHGAEWYHPHPGMSDHDFATMIDAAETQLWPALVELAHGRKLLVAGFSQGAVMTYVLAARHADAIAYAFPISGRMPIELFPTALVRTAPLYALHGTADPVIGIDEARPAIAAFTAAGGRAELHEYPGVGHTISQDMYDDFVRHVLAAL